MKMPFLTFCGDGMGGSFSLSQLSTSEAIPALDSAALTSTTAAEICHKGTFSMTYDKVENTAKKVLLCSSRGILRQMAIWVTDLSNVINAVDGQTIAEWRGGRSEVSSGPHDRGKVPSCMYILGERGGVGSTFPLLTHDSHC